MTSYTLFVYCCAAYGVGLVLRVALYCADYRRLPSTTIFAEIAFASVSMPLAVLVVYWFAPMFFMF